VRRRSRLRGRRVRVEAAESRSRNLKLLKEIEMRSIMNTNIKTDFMGAILLRFTLKEEEVEIKEEIQEVSRLLMKTMIMSHVVIMIEYRKTIIRKTNPKSTEMMRDSNHQMTTGNTMTHVLHSMAHPKGSEVAEVEEVEEEVEVGTV